VRHSAVSRRVIRLWPHDDDALAPHLATALPLLPFVSAPSPHPAPAPFVTEHPTEPTRGIAGMSVGGAKDIGAAHDAANARMKKMEDDLKDLHAKLARLEASVQGRAHGRIGAGDF